MYFRSLQMLRGLAAVAVVLFHVNEFTRTICNAPETVFRVFDVKFGLGAWFFFALSGFLMAYMLDTSCDRFLSRRLIRIYPTFWLAACVTLVAKIALFGSIANPRLIGALSLMPRGGNVTYPLGVEWTLVYEVFFYLVCTVFTVSRLRPMFPVFLACWGAAIVTANLRYGFVSLMLPNPGQIVFSLFNLLFIMGGLGYHAYKHLEWTARVRRLLILTAIGGLAASYYGADQEVLKFSGLGLIFAAVIVWGSMSDRHTNPKPGGSFLERLGDASYGLYLIHVPIVTCFMSYMAHHRGFKDPTTLAVLGTVLAMVAGWYFGKLDLLIHKSLKNQLIRPRSLAVAGSARPHFGRKSLATAEAHKHSENPAA